MNKYISKIMLLMFGAFALTALCGNYIAHTPELLSMFFNITSGKPKLNWLGIISIFLPLLVILLYSFSGNKFKLLFFVLFSLSYSVTFTLILVRYDINIILQALGLSSVVFISTALYGFFTKHDLSTLGNFCLNAIVGLILVSIANMFFHLPMLNTIISAISVLVFSGFVAYDMQKIKDNYTKNYDINDLLDGAIELYIDFMGIFINILSLLDGSDD